MQFPSHGLQNSLAQYSQNKNVTNASEVMRRLVVVVGCAGCGVQAVGGLIKKRLTSHEGLNRCTVGSVEINLTDIELQGKDSGEGFLLALDALTVAAFKAGSTDHPVDKSSVIIVVVTTTAQSFIPQSDLLKYIETVAFRECAVSVSVSAVVAVVTPKGMLCDAITGSSW